MRGTSTWCQSTGYSSSDRRNAECHVVYVHMPVSGMLTGSPAVQLGATMMSSFLVNSALILLCSTAVVQFCAQAFEEYAQETAIQQVFGTEIFHLESTRPIFQNNVFIYVLLAFSVLTMLYLLVRGPGNRRHKKLSLEEIYALG